MGKKKEEQQQQQMQEDNEECEAQEEENNNQTTFQDIFALEAFQINTKELQSIKEAGYPTVESFMMATLKELETNVKAFNDQKYAKMKEAIKKMKGSEMNFGSLYFSTGLDQQQKRKNITRITTGSQKFDQMIGGGIESRCITEVYGEFRTGKTQLVHTLCVTCQLGRSDGGGQGKALYIDTEGTFRPERIGKIAERFGLDGEQALENIVYARAYSVTTLDQILTEASNLLFECGPFALIVVDSIMALFRVDFSGRGELSERQQLLGQTMKKLLKLSEVYNTAVFITNQVMADPSGQSHGDNKKPIGGCVLAHASTNRIQLKKGQNEIRKAMLVDSPCLKDDTIEFQVAEDGVRDVK